MLYSLETFQRLPTIFATIFATIFCIAKKASIVSAQSFDRKDNSTEYHVDFNWHSARPSGSHGPPSLGALLLRVPALPALSAD